MATQTRTSTVAAALMLAGTQAPTTAPIFRGFGSKPGGSGSGGNPPGGGGGPPGPFGPPGGGVPRGGAPLGPARGAGGGMKLGGNPPPEFDGNCSYAITFMNKFNLYRLANMEAEQMEQPMKRAALLLGFIKGPNIDDWVQLRMDEMLDRYNRGISPHDPIYWDDLGAKFMQAFNDTASWEQAEEKLQHLAWIPGDVDTFLAQFRTLADQAQYPIDAQPTITLLASKLLYKMMNHIFMIVKPRNFEGWVDAAHQYHQDSMAVQNVRGVYEDTPRKGPFRKGFLVKQWAQILGVKMPTPDPNVMDTRADRSHSKFKYRKGSKGRVSTTKEDSETQHKEGHCFTCNKQGHLARNCPDKSTNKPRKTKARMAKTTDSDNGEITETPDELNPKTYLRLGQSLSEEAKVTFIQKIIDADKGEGNEDLGF
jgi:hypothetical protein